jgi:ATP-dependent protease ClpP protease subunit
MKRLALTTAVMAVVAAIRADVSQVPAGQSLMRLKMLATGEAELLIYGYIGESLFTNSNGASTIVAQLGEINAGVIQVRVNSQGGSVPDGLAIYNALRRHPARKVITVDGQAASIASLIVQAGDERIMPDNTMMMVHAPGCNFCDGNGNAAQHREMANQLDTWALSMKASYLAKAPTRSTELQTMLTDGADHYFTAQEAVDFGLADKVLSAVQPELDDIATAAALLGYIAAVDYVAQRPQLRAPKQFTACLRKRINASVTPNVFASLPEASQRALLAHIEDPTMHSKLSSIMAAAAGAPAPAPAPTPAPAPAAAAPTPAPVAAAPTPAPAPVPSGAAPDPVAAVAERNTRVREIFAPYRDVQGMRDLELTCICDPRMTIEAVQQQVLNRLGGRAEPARPAGGGSVEPGVDEGQRLREAGVSYLMARAGLLPVAEAERARQGNPYLNCSLVGMAERSLIRAGINTREMDRERICAVALNPSRYGFGHVQGAQTTSDFPILLENTLHKMLLAGYRLTPFTWSRFCATGTLSDYRPHPRYHLSSFSDLAGVNEHGEYQLGTLGDGSKETIQGSRKGRLLGITPEVLVNDDLGAISRPVIVLGQAAGRTIEKDVFALFALNSGDGPTMSDGHPLFDATNHHNSAGSTAPTAAAWDVARQAMGSQKDPGGNDYLDISPAIWLGPLSLGTQARVVNTSEFNPDDSKNQKYAPPNTSRGMVRDVIDTPRLSGTAWYLLADASSEPVFEVAFLNGVQTPTIEQEVNFKSDGLTWKVSHRYGVGAVGWRGIQRNPGA